MTHILQRGDTAAAWTYANPTLMEREVGWETDTLRFKLGDGVTPWSELPYVGFGGGGGGGAVTSVNGRVGDVVLNKTDVGLSSVNNTSDAAKPISAATQAALNDKAALTHTHTGTDIQPGTITGDRLADSSVQLEGNAVDGVLPVERGGTGATSLSGLRALLDVPEWRMIIVPAMPAGVWSVITDEVAPGDNGVIESVWNLTNDTRVIIDWRANPALDRFELRPDVDLAAGTYGAVLRGRDL